MRIIPIANYNEHSMQLAKPVYDKYRRVLLAAGSTVHPKYLEMLKDLGIRSLFVEDAQSKGITMEELIDMPTWMDVIDLLTEVYKSAKEKKAFQASKVYSSVGRLMMEVKQRAIVLPFDISAVPEEIGRYAHAVNVTLLALQIGKSLAYNDLMLRDLGIGCLLHDIGKAVKDDQHKHPEEGFSILRANREFSLLSAHVAYQHHETLDGKGYPRGIQGTAFHEYAQICGLCNLYENKIASGELPTHEIMEYIMTLSGSMYAAHIVEAFVRVIPSYTPGTLVELNNGKQAIVTKITSHMQRPSIRYMDTNEELSLAENPTLMISQTVSIIK